MKLAEEMYFMYEKQADNANVTLSQQSLKLFFKRAERLEKQNYTREEMMQILNLVPVN